MKSAKKAGASRSRTRRPARAAEPRGATVVSATDAARRFADLLNRAVYRGQRFLVERGGKAAVEIRPVREAPVSFSELVSILRSAPRPDTDFGDDLEAVTRAQAGISASPWES